MSRQRGNDYATLVAAAFYAKPVRAPTLPTAQEDSKNNQPIADEFVAKQAKELGFTTAELTGAIGKWANSTDFSGGTGPYANPRR